MGNKRKRKIKKAFLNYVPKYPDWLEPIIDHYKELQGEIKRAFMAGAAWADRHPQSPFISVKKLPPVDKDIITYDINEDTLTYAGKLAEKDENEIICFTHWMYFNTPASDNKQSSWGYLKRGKDFEVSPSNEHDL